MAGDILNMVEQVGGGSVIDGATPSSLGHEEKMSSRRRSDHLYKYRCFFFGKEPLFLWKCVWLKIQ